MLLYGSNMSNSNAHDHFPLPNLVVGGGAGRMKGGRHLQYPDHTPMTNLLVTMLDKVGVKQESLGDSTGLLSELVVRRSTASAIRTGSRGSQHAELIAFVALSDPACTLLV